MLTGRRQKAPPSGELANGVSLRGLAPSQRELSKPTGFDGGSSLIILVYPLPFPPILMLQRGAGEFSTGKKR